MGLDYLGTFLLIDDQIQPGRAAPLKAFELSGALGNMGIAAPIYQLALILAVSGEAVTAARLAGFTDADIEQHQLSRIDIATAIRNRLVERLRRAMSPDECQSAMGAGGCLEPAGSCRCRRGSIAIYLRGARIGHDSVRRHAGSQLLTS